MAPPTFRCGCGSFEAKFDSGPAWDSTCHCRSCVAVARFIDEKYGRAKGVGGTTEEDGETGETGGGTSGGTGGTSALSDEGGSTMSFFELGDISFLPGGKKGGDKEELLSERVGHVKVGERGKVVRTYAKCCGTQIMHCHMNLCGFNRNALYNDDGTKYRPDGPPPLNIMAKFAFEPAKVPEPKCNYVTFPFVANVIPFAVRGILGMGYGERTSGEEKAVHPNPSEAEVVPVTWE